MLKTLSLAAFVLILSLALFYTLGESRAERDRKAALKTLSAYGAALGRGQAGPACRALTPRYRKRVGTQLGLKGKDCYTAVGALEGFILLGAKPSKARELVGNLKKARVKVYKNRIRVTSPLKPGLQMQFRLLKRGKAWKIDDSALNFR